MASMNDLLKTQMMLSIGASKTPLLNIVALNLFDIGTKTFPLWSAWTQAMCCRRKKSSSPRTPHASITCERGVSQQTQTGRGPMTQTLYQSRMDAVVHYVSTVPAMKSLLSVSHHDYLPNEFEPVLLDNDVYFELVDLKINDGQLEIIKFKIFCYDHDIQHLQSFVENCNADYERRMANKLGTHRYYFDQVVQQKVKGTVQNPLPTSHLLYTKSKFTTTRSFENVFFDQRNDVRNRTQFFLENRDWYDKKGIPYTLGFMFHGPPGTGKTSSVKAIAHEGRRHIINVQLSEIKTKAQLQHLFFNDEIHVYNGTNSERYTIPVSERLYVIEDIDAMGDTVLRREWKKPTPLAPKKDTGDAWNDRETDPDKETIDLSFLLNLLDGTLEANGRVLIITTNFPERIDRALIRPGRIDMIVNFRRCSRDIAQEMVDAFYDRHVEIPEGDIHEKWSPAEVNQILFRNFECPDQAVRELVDLRKENLYGFENESQATQAS